MLAVTVALLLCAGSLFPAAKALHLRAPRPACRFACAHTTMMANDEDASLTSKGVWFATELFGKASALLRADAPGVDPPVSEGAAAPASLEEAVRRLATDYHGTAADPRPYFLTGIMDSELYDTQCEFADPFVSFEGRERFEANLRNLAGGFIIGSQCRVLDASTDLNANPPSYTTRLLVKLQLGLPWRPVLAWVWGVEHVFDPESHLVVKHIERWEVSAAEGVRQLLSAGPPQGLQQGRTGCGGGGGRDKREGGE